MAYLLAFLRLERRFLALKQLHVRHDNKAPGIFFKNGMKFYRPYETPSYMSLFLGVLPSPRQASSCRQAKLIAHIMKIVEVITTITAMKVSNFS